MLTKYPSDYHAQFSEDRRALVKTLYTSMKTDYGQQFTAQFANNNPVQWLHRVMDLTQGFADDAIADGFQEAVMRSPKFPPSIPAIIAEISTIHVLRKQQAKNDEERRVLCNINPMGQAKIAKAMQGINIKKADKSPRELLAVAIQYDLSLYPVNPDKSLITMRRAAMAAARHDESGKSAAQIMADVAKGLGAEWWEKYCVAIETECRREQSRGESYA